jgi:hypothetical protein
MNLCILLLCSMVLMVMPAFAREKSDVIVMRNGDRLTCEIKGLNSGVLYVGLDYILGTSSVQWSKVHHVESSQLFIVKTESGLVYTGTLSTASQSATDRPTQIEVAVDPQTEVTVDRTQVIQMVQTSENFWQRFNGDINTGIIYSKGNQSTQFSLNSDVEYPRERWSAQASYSSTLASSTGANASARNQVVFGGQRLLRWNNWFYEGVGVLLQSSEQNINIQSTLGSGVGRYLKNTNNVRISILGGLGWQDTQYKPTTQSLGNQSLATAIVTGKMQFFRFNKTSFDVSGIVLPALTQPGRVHVDTNISYYIKVFSNLTWNVSFYGNWDTRPPANFSGSDYGTSSGLGWTFGNR